MNNNIKPPDDLAHGLELVLENNKEQLSIEDNEILESTIKMLKELDSPKLDTQSLVNSGIKIVANLIEFFAEK